MNTLLDALDPHANAVVEACAGSGKTWLLVSRMIRLLLAGARPSDLLAITFTRKAAGEMRQRLYDWLEHLVLAEDDAVLAFLVERGLSAAEARVRLPEARGLFAQVMHARPGPEITTFHGWFLKLLAHAPLSHRPPGTLAEGTAQLLDEAWLGFTESLRARNDSPEEAAFRALITELPLASVKALLLGFVDKRAEWWAWAEGRDDALAETVAAHAELAGVAETEDVLAPLFAEAGFLADLQEYHGLLARQGAGVKEAAKRAEMLAEVIEGLRRDGSPALRDALAFAPSPLPTGGGGASSAGTGENRRSARPCRQDGGTVVPPYGDAPGANSDAQLLAGLQAALLTQAGEPRAWKASKTLDERLTPAGAERFLELHVRLCEAVIAVQDRLEEQAALRLHRWALTAGLGLLAHYQRLKAERDQIDFTDAEWEVARLLADPEVSAALQMKLDARYAHLLLDEFQDANPLQWRILQEWLASYGDDAARPTVFVVGDPKQSIYRFRRAEPRVLVEARHFLEQYFDARYFPQNETRRCAPHVVAWVNAVFEGRADYPGFTAHAAHQTQLSGWCEAIAVPVPETSAPEARAWRNPLTTPAPEASDKRTAEAVAVAERIQAVVGHLRVGAKGRPARYGDVLVLFAKRAGLAVFEAEFKARGIPFVGNRQGQLLHTLEADDLMALLECFSTPFADLRLAQVLKSPIFGLDDADLMALARRGQDGATADRQLPWFDRLAAWAAEAGAPLRVVRAWQLLSSWLAEAGHLPAHDLLDRVFHQGEVEARYLAAVPERLQAGVRANLRAFLALTLEIGGGRFPSLPRLLDDLRALRDKAGNEAPDEATQEAGDAVRMLTIHAAKGLEAPVVFLIKADEAGGDRDHLGVLLDWPAGEPRPAHFSLYGSQGWRGRARTSLFEQEQAAAARERLNLLYVAMTRAEQALFVSGLVAEAKAARGWLGEAQAALEAAEFAGLPEMVWQAGEARENAPTVASATLPVLPGPVGQRRETADTATRFGILVHRQLELLGQGRTLPAAEQRAEPELQAEAEAAARTLLATPALQCFFSPEQHLRARNELEYLNAAGELRRIDRLVEFEDAVWVLDYKTGAAAGMPPPAHVEQLREYRAAMKALYPDKPLHAALVYMDGQLWTLDGEVEA